MKLVVGLFLSAWLLTSQLSQAAHPTSQVNVVQNPSFNNLLDNWSASSVGETMWVPNFGIPDSSGLQLGSAAIAAVPNSGAYLQQCALVNGGITYKLAFSSLSYCAESARVELSFGDENCNSATGTFNPISIEEFGNWTRSSVEVATPIGVRGVNIILENTAVCDDVVFFDEISFSDRIFSASFD